MHPFSVVFFHILTFCAGGMCFVNLANLVTVQQDYDYAWWKVAAFLILGVVFSLMTHAERRYKPFTQDRHRLG